MDLKSRTSVMSKLEWRKVANVALSSVRDLLNVKNLSRMMDTAQIHVLRMSIKVMYSWGGDQAKWSAEKSNVHVFLHNFRLR